MNVRNSSGKNKNSLQAGKTRKKREELSISATKSISDTNGGEGDMAAVRPGHEPQKYSDKGETICIEVLH